MTDVEKSETPADSVTTPLDLRPELDIYGIEEYDRGICEDKYEYRSILRKNKLSWSQIYDKLGHPTGYIEVLSQEMSEGRSLNTLQDRRGLLVDPRDNNSDFITGLDLMYNADADELVAPWILAATRAYYQIEKKRSEDPLKPVRPMLDRYPARCRYIKADGIRCLLWNSGRKTDDDLCRLHLGSLNANVGVGAVERARQRVQQIAPIAVDVMEEMMSTATSEPVRLRAAEQLLDRAGVRGGVEIDLTATVEVRPAAEILRERMNRMRENLTKKEITATPTDSDTSDATLIIDAEIVEDEDHD